MLIGSRIEDLIHHDAPPFLQAYFILSVVCLFRNYANKVYERFQVGGAFSGECLSEDW